MNNAGGGNQFISRVATEVQPSARTGYLTCQRPDVQATKHSCNVRVVQVHGDSPQLRQLRYLPQHDCGNAPGLSTQEPGLARLEYASDGVQQNMGVNVQQAT